MSICVFMQDLSPAGKTTGGTADSAKSHNPEEVTATQRDGRAPRPRRAAARSSCSEHDGVTKDFEQLSEFNNAPPQNNEFAVNLKNVQRYIGWTRSRRASLVICGDE